MIRVPPDDLGRAARFAEAGVEVTAVTVEFDPAVRKQIESEVRTIKAEFQGRVPEESIDLVATESIQRLASSRVPQFVPLFVGRFTRQRLRELMASRKAAKN